MSEHDGTITIKHNTGREQHKLVIMLLRCSSACHIVYFVIPVRGCAHNNGTFLSTTGSGVNQTAYARTEPKVTP